MESFLTQLKDNWLIISTLVGALFYLKRVRDEEALRSRLKIMADSYEAFSLLNDLIQNWAREIVLKGEDQDESLARGLSELMPNARKHYFRARLFLSDGVTKHMEEVFSDISKMLGAYGSWNMLREANKEAGGAYNKEIRESYDQAKKQIPEKIKKANESLLSEFRSGLNGSFWFWCKQ